MSKTQLFIKTFMCPLGLGNPDAECRFHREVNNMTEDGKCPVHKLDLVKTTDPNDKVTRTIMGKEDIELEIERENKDRTEKGKNTMTTVEENTHRAKRIEDIAKAIAEARLLEDI